MGVGCTVTFFAGDRTIIADMMVSLGWSGALLFYRGWTGGEGSVARMEDFEQDFLRLSDSEHDDPTIVPGRLVSVTGVGLEAERSTSGMLILVQADVDMGDRFFGLDGFEHQTGDAVCITVASTSDGRVNWIPTPQENMSWNDVTGQLGGLQPPNRDIVVFDDGAGLLVSPLTVLTFPRMVTDSGVETDDQWAARLSYLSRFTLFTPNPDLLCLTRVVMDSLGDAVKESPVGLLVVPGPLAFSDTVTVSRAPGVPVGENTVFGVGRESMVGFNLCENMPSGLVVGFAGDRFTALEVRHVDGEGTSEVVSLSEGAVDALGRPETFVRAVLPDSSDSVVKPFAGSVWSHLVDVVLSDPGYADRVESGRQVLAREAQAARVLGGFTFEGVPVSVVRSSESFFTFGGESAPDVDPDVTPIGATLDHQAFVPAW